METVDGHQLANTLLVTEKKMLCADCCTAAKEMVSVQMLFLLSEDIFYQTPLLTAPTITIAVKSYLTLVILHLEVSLNSFDFEFLSIVEQQTTHKKK